MNVEQLVYISAIEGLVKEPDCNLAIDLLREWSGEAKGKNKAAAACYYLAHNVIPTLGGFLSLGVPEWVMEELFDFVPDLPRNAEEWVAAFPGSAILSFNDRETKKGSATQHGRQTPRINDFKDNQRGIFLTANPVRGVSHADEEVTAYRFFFIDFDGGDKLSIVRKIEKMQIKPSIITETLHGYHVYFRLRKNKMSEATWREMERRIVETEGGDMSSTNPGRVLRMPFTWNCKESEPFLVQIIDWNDRRYSLEDFESAYPKPKPKTPFFRRNVYEYRPSIKPAPNGILTKDNRHGGLEDWCKAAYFRIRENREMAASLRQYAKEWYEDGHSPKKQNWEKEVDDLCDWFEKKQWGSVVSR